MARSNNAPFDHLLTPALIVDTDIVRQNIGCMQRLLGGDLRRWRPHLKTVKISRVMRMLVDAGVHTAKCATTRELLVACESGFDDVLVSFSHMGANAARVAQIAEQFPNVHVSTLVEDAEQIASWRGTRIGIFVDVNLGMNRTGIEEERGADIARLIREILDAGLDFRGLHGYDGHATEENVDERTEHAHARYRKLIELVDQLKSAGMPVREIVTTGTPALPCGASFEPFRSGSFRHQVSPGTTVYCDLSSLKQLPEAYGFAPAVSVLSRVISHPLPNVITCDAGHKAVSVDSGVPNCAAVGHPELRPLKPSEEHLPIEVAPGSEAPRLGSLLRLIPRHVCPTVNNANFAVLIAGGEISSIEEVTARGHERPLFGKF